MSETRKPILCLDFDGCIHSYERGWQDGSIYGTVVPGFWAWATRAKVTFQLVIYSSRSKTDEGRSAMSNWLINQWGIYIDQTWLPDSDGPPEGIIMPADFTFTHEKPPAFLTIDDRCVRFDGNWESAFLEPGILRLYRGWTQNQEAPTPTKEIV